MHIYQVKQKLAKDDNFTITKNHDKVYQIKGEILSWGHKLSFQDMEGKELACIKQFKAQGNYPVYQIIRDDNMWAELRTDSIFETKDLTLDIPGPNDYKVHGDVMAWHFKIERTETHILAGTIDKQWGIMDTYGVKIEEGEDDIAVLLICICIDQIWHEGK